MDEFTAVLKARAFVRSFRDLALPVAMEPYVEKVGATIRYDADLADDQSGYSLPIKGQWHIIVNARDVEERQRFTICHELGHLHLGLSSEHIGKSDLQLYTKRPKNEILCDVFASEILLPSDLFKPLVNEAEMGFQSVITLARDFEASWTATGSRFAALNQTPCVFVLAERGFVRYASQSLPLREMGAWVQLGAHVPPSSLAAQGERLSRHGPCSVDPAEWFEDWTRGGTLYEDARYLAEWKRTLSLLWFEESYLPSREEKETEGDEESDPYCKELDGNLPWPDRTRKR